MSYSSSEFRRLINGLTPIDDKPTVIFKDPAEPPNGGYEFLPTVHCTYDPFGDTEFEDILVHSFHAVCSFPEVFKQSTVPDYFVKCIDSWQPMLAAFLVIDGLSFVDFRDTGSLPCLVDGVSLTPAGIRRLVGSPHIVERLFERGYYKRVGFSYWDRNNELTDKFFYSFAEGQLHRVESFDAVLAWLETTFVSERTYIQIFRIGLDGYAHNHRDRPPKEYIIRAIKEDVANLVERLRNMAPSFVLLVTADHGILWTQSIPNEAIYLNEGTGPLRYYSEGESIPESAAKVGVWHLEDKAFSLPVNWYRRKAKITEWGCHGGISIAESFVPLILHVG